MSFQIPFNDLTRLSDDLKQEISKTAARISTSGSYILGQEVLAFENELANYLGLKKVVGLASGTDALILALLALRLGPGDVVLTVANAGGYTTIAAKAVGAEPVFVDIDPETLGMSLNGLAKSFEICKAAGLNPKVVVVTHLFGQLNPQILDLLQFAHSNNLALVEDCAQSLGARNHQGLAGSFGDLATFSFYPTKNLGASGDGGAVGGTNLEIIERVLMLRQYGWSNKYYIDLPDGRNSRLDEIQAAILRIKLRYLDGWNSHRREIYFKYQQAANEKVIFFSIPDESFVAHLAVISVKNCSQQKIKERFESESIEASIHYPVPDHKQSIALKFNNLVPLPATEAALNSIVSIPLFTELTNLELQAISSVLSTLGD
jgi:aminotransferase EvaB